MSLILFLIFSSFKSLYAWFFRVDEIMKKSANSSQCNVLNSIATSPVQWMRYLNISELSSKFTFTLFFEGSPFRCVKLFRSMIITWTHQIKTKSKLLQRLFSFICKLFAMFNNLFDCYFISYVFKNNSRFIDVDYT